MGLFLRVVWRDMLLAEARVLFIYFKFQAVSLTTHINKYRLLAERLSWLENRKFIHAHFFGCRL